MKYTGCVRVEMNSWWVRKPGDIRSTLSIECGNGLQIINSAVRVISRHSLGCEKVLCFFQLF